MVRIVGKFVLAIVLFPGSLSVPLALVFGCAHGSNAAPATASAAELTPPDGGLPRMPDMGPLPEVAPLAAK